PAASATASEEKEDPDSPRTSMRSFLYLTRHGRYDEAARYLDIAPAQQKRSAELAQKLSAVLAERVRIDPENVSPHSLGSGGGFEEIGKVEGDTGSVSIRLVRHAAKGTDDEARWVFAQTTVEAIDSLYAKLNGRWITDELPPSLLRLGPKSLYWWQWIALPLLALLCLAIGRVFARITTVTARAVLVRMEWLRRFATRLERPLTMAWTVGVFSFLVPYLALTLRAEDFLDRILRAAGWLAFFWALLRAVTVAAEEVVTADWARAKPSVRSLTSVGTKLGKFVVASLALMVALSELGYPVTSVVAGLGIGGVALALAAQKTVADLFGSVAILADQPFRVGDTIRVDGVEGTVESIGLRSTRMRTVERTLVIIPNGKLADMRIESFGERDRIRFSAKLEISREASRDQLAAIRDAIKKALAAHEKVQASEVFVRFSGLGAQSYDLDVAAPVDTHEWLEFAKIREELLLACVQAVEQAGTRLALPTRQMLSSAGAS
ncbi:MAG TPA: mechanosensitive ion channel family protein, partial [Labilithrix sp.]